MTPADLSRTVLRAVRRAVDENALRAPVPARVRVERSRPGGSGDYACAVALQLAGDAGLPALEVARILRERVAAEPGIGRVEITGPGFLSLTLDAPCDNDRAVLDAVREQGSAYGHGGALRDELLRFHHAREVRAAVTADAVRRLLISQGARVRVSCEEASDSDWSRLGVTVDAHGTPPVPLTSIRPVPAGATAAELLERLGADAARWGLLRPASHDRAPLGDDLLVQAEANPLFRIRYAHARARALTRGAAALGFSSAPAATPYTAPAVHVHAEPTPVPYGGAARPLLDLLADHPGVLLAAARHRAPDRVARQLEAVAHAFFDFHDSCSPLPSGDEKPSAAHRSRLALAEAAGTVLAGGLSLLGISAPAHL
ncbi:MULTISPECIES: ArgS-related anticodon-binding protein NrtL [unclassified Streptomyces]|uniref:ArgS-related anticodon-binding protein NrtL n=1 Tax=unclassified Streptomyces TaxID=2593676 RepID=UPI00344E9C0E